MTPDAVVTIMRQALMAAFWISLPLLALGLAAGIGISLLQIITSIQDTGFTSASRLVAYLAGLLLLMPWMLQRMMSYTSALLGDFTRYAR